MAFAIGKPPTGVGGFVQCISLRTLLSAANRANKIQTSRLSCCKFRNNEVRLQLHALAYNLGNFLRTLALPDAVEQWSLTTLKDKLIKIGAKVVSHGRYVTFQMAEVAVPGTLFANIMRLIGQLRSPPDAASA